MSSSAKVAGAGRPRQLYPGLPDQPRSLAGPVVLARLGGHPGEESPELPPGIYNRQIRGYLVRSRGAAHQPPQNLVTLGVHGERCRRRVFPVGVIPEVREQDLDRVVRGKTSDLIGHKLLSYRPVDEAAQGLPRVNIVVNGRGDVVQRLCVSITQPDSLSGDVVCPRSDAGNGMIAGCPGPGPRPQHRKAGTRIRLVIATYAASVPATGEHAPDHQGVKVGPAVRQRPIAADDAVKGKYQMASWRLAGSPGAGRSAR